MKVETLLEQAQFLSDNENYEKSYELLKTAYELDKTNPEILEKIALQAKMLEKMEEAAGYWEALIGVDPNSILAYSELQDIYFHTNKYKYYLTRAKVKILHENVSQSISDYKKAIENTQIEREIIEARLLLAKAYEFMGKTVNAIDEYFKIVEMEENLIVYYKLFDLYSLLNDKSSAMNILQKAIEAYPDESNLKELMAGVLFETDQPDEALEYVQSDLTKAKIYLAKEENDKAFRVLNLMEDKTSSNYFALLAEYYYNTKDFDKCLENVTAFKKLEPQSPLTYQMMALVYEEKDDLYNSHFNWGKFYIQKNDFEMAMNEYMQAHNLNPKDAQVIKEIIKLNENTGDSSSLIEFYEKLLVVEPDNQSALKSLGKFYENMHEFKNALDFYLKVEELNRNDTDILKDIAVCYEKLRKSASAKEYYQKYLDKAPLGQDTEDIKLKVSKMSDENVAEDEGLLEKIARLFSKK